MNGIRYFRAGVDDASVLADLRVEFLLMIGEQTAEAIATLRTQLTVEFSEFLADGSYICWLAERNGEVVATGGMAIRRQPGNFKNPVGRTGYIMSMYTKPEHRGKGICSELVRRLVSSGHESGIEHFELHATKAGEPVYQKLGFLLHSEPTYRMHAPAPSNKIQQP